MVESGLYAHGDAGAFELHTAIAFVSEGGGMITTFWLWVYRIARAYLHAKRGPHMVCCACGLLIHRHDRFRVVDVVHLDCRDPKRVGQMSPEGDK